MRRRELLTRGGAALLGLAAGDCATGKHLKIAPLRTRNPKKVLVLWYSQTGHTETYGRLIGKIWQGSGMEVKASDYRSIKPTELVGHDLIVVGSPVFYMEVPSNLREWLSRAPKITGTAVAAFASFGGPGDGQHNVCCTLLETMAAKGGVPVGMATFGNMSAFAPTWSLGNHARTLKYRHLPDESTFKAVRSFAATVLAALGSGKVHNIKRQFHLGGLMSGGPSIWMTKWLARRHRINPKTCVSCGTCERKCPVLAVNVANRTVDRKRCIACLGCVNNCPTGAMGMTFLQSRVYGFRRFLEKFKIVRKVPPELGKG